MRKLVVILSLLFIPALFSAQSSTQWQQIYGGGGVEVGYSVKTCLGQGYIVAGQSSSLGVTDGYVVRTDTLGLVMWEKFYGGVNIDVIRSVKLLPDSGYILAGYTNSFGTGGYDGWVLRIDKNGDTLWTKTVGTTDWDFFYDVTTTWDSGFVFAGGTYGMGNGEEDMLFVKLDSVGNLEWMRTYGGVKEDEARGVVETTDSLLVGCGYSKSLGDSLGDTWILRINGNNGDTLWSRKGTHTNGADLALGIAAGTNRFGVVGQYTTATGDLNAFVHVMFLDSTTQLDLTAGIAGYEYYSGIVFLTTSYNFATLGSTQNDGGGSGDFFMFHDVDYSAHSYGTTDIEAGYGIDATPRKGYIACGYTEGYNSLVANLYLVKIDSTGFSTNILAIREAPELIASTRSYPNPAGSTATITIDAMNPLNGVLRLSLADATGKTIGSDLGENWTMYSSQSASCHIQTSELKSGIYFYTISDNSGFITNGKIIVAH